MRISADIYTDGHGALGARAFLLSNDPKTITEPNTNIAQNTLSEESPHQPEGGRKAHKRSPNDSPNRSGSQDNSGGSSLWDALTAALEEAQNDNWVGYLTPHSVGEHTLVIQAWPDAWATWIHRVQVLAEAGEPLEIELEEGARILSKRASGLQGSYLDSLHSAILTMRNTQLETDQRLGAAMQDTVRLAMIGPQDEAEISAVSTPIWVDRPKAGFSTWYELFPRSYGGFSGVSKRLQSLAEMGFDILYMPPIHPIGRTARKGPGNSLVAHEDDPGSPWAIGNELGGHETIEPSLGTLEEFEALVAQAAELGIEIALDYALQCSPDHPWIKEHPEWFHHRADGTIAYAENPPKKYQDIVPINFWPPRETHRLALWNACLGILLTWIERGVRVFRVDNPHTKPVAFWAWCIEAVHRQYPDVIFLAEAFTRPKMMAKLAEVGFSQSYTYFTWRTTAAELGEYGDEVHNGPSSDYLRPCFWPTTPDILSGPLRGGNRGAFASRAVLAATMSPNYGIYSGYELMENIPASEVNEEHFASEKFELKSRDLSGSPSIAPLLATLNEIRLRHSALQEQGNFSVVPTSNSAIFAYIRRSVGALDSESDADTLLIVVNLDSFAVHEATLTLDLAALGLPWDRPFEARDELSGERYVWAGPHPYVRLDGSNAPSHVLALEPIR